MHFHSQEHFDNVVQRQMEKANRSRGPSRAECAKMAPRTTRTVPIAWFSVIAQETVQELRENWGEKRIMTTTVTKLDGSDPSEARYAYLGLVQEEDVDEFRSIVWENDEEDLVVSLSALADSSITPCSMSSSVVGTFPDGVREGADIRVEIEISEDDDGKEHISATWIRDVHDEGQQQAA